jgi:hypothetical protein
MTTENSFQMSQEQINAIHRMWQYFPYRTCYLMTKEDKWEVISPKNRRSVNQMIKDGWKAYETL